jgi:hypothetical protein
MERYSVWASSDQVWSTSIHRRRKELPFMVISENASCNTTEIASHMANPSWVFSLSLIWPHVSPNLWHGTGCFDGNIPQIVILLPIAPFNNRKSAPLLARIEW